MAELCGSEHLADVCLVVCGVRMPAHRHVLAPHSRVFARMWASAMSEVSVAGAAWLTCAHRRLAATVTPGLVPRMAI